MKEYVLDFAEPQAAPVAEPEQAPPPRRVAWRSIALLIVLESFALALLYVVLIGFPGASEASLETAAAPATVNAPATVVDRSPASATATPLSVEAPPRADAVEPTADAAPSRIAREHGRYVIELHSVAIGTALEMLTKATGASVRGIDVLAGNGTRITRTVAADSPLEAWQAVFGGVVNFAATCSRAACAVRFVSSADPALAAVAPRAPAGGAAEAAESSEPADLAAVAASIAAGKPPPATAIAARTPLPPPVAVQEGGEPMPDN